MPSTHLANGRTIVHLLSADVHQVFPDACKTPTPAGTPPIPYPNIGSSIFTTDGPKKVTVDGVMPMVQGAKYPLTNGDEAGVAGGVASGVNLGEAEFMLYSFDVKFEGKNVCRTGDPMFHNKKNAMG